MTTLDMPTFVFIDVSNIRGACLRSCSINLDFVRLYDYLKKKYLNLREVRYYEGISLDDEKKRRHFGFLEKTGYKVCSLERMEYVEPPVYKSFVCDNCGKRNVVQILPENKKLKSNVDVYLASDMIGTAVTQKGTMHLILMSCDGDYAEAINTVLRINEDVRITIMAPPMTRKNNRSNCTNVCMLMFTL